MPTELGIPALLWQRYAAYQDACAETLGVECLWCNPHGRGAHRACAYHKDPATLPLTHPRLWTPDEIRRIHERAKEYDFFGGDDDEIKIGGTD